MDNVGNAQAGYYSPPQLGSEAQSYRNKKKEQQLAWKKAGNTLASLEHKYRENAASLEQLRGYLDNIKKQYAAAPSEQMAQRYERVYKQYETLSQKSRNAYYDYMRGVDSYKSAAEQYQSASKAYETYKAGQRSQYDAWKSTIRDQDSIRAELDALDAQIAAQKQSDIAARQTQYAAAQDEKPWYEKLAGYLGGAQDTSLPTYSHVKDPDAAVRTSDEMKALQDKRALLQEEYEWSGYFADAALRESEEFKTGAAAGLQAYKSQKAAQQAQGDKSFGQQWLEHNANAYLAANDNPLLGAWNQLAQQYRQDTSYQEPSDQWSQEQLDMFGYYYSQSPAKAYKYAEMVNNEIAWDVAQEQKNAIGEKASESFLSGVGHTLGALATAPMALADVMDNLAEYAGRGTITARDTVSPYGYSQAVVSGISQKLNAWGTLDASVPVIGGKGLGDLYGIGFSTAQSLLSGAMHSGALTAVQFFGQGAAAGMQSGLENGANGTRAMFYGLVSGAAEAFAEKMGVDRLFKLSSASTFKAFVKNVAKQAMSEGIEETATAIVDSIADRLILGENSTFRKRVKEYEQSMSHDDAVRLAWTETINTVVFDGLSGMLSGGLGAGLRTGYLNTVQGIARMQTQKAEKQPAKAGTAFQADIQKQVSESLTRKNGAQTGTVRLADMQVEINDATFQQGQRLAKALNKQIVFYADAERGFVNGYIKNGVIWVNTKGHDPLLQVFSHELTHSLEGADSYGDLSSIVLGLIEQSGVNLDTARQAKADLYARRGEALQNESAIDQELVAEYVSKHLLTDEKTITSLVRKHRSLGQRIRKWFDTALALFGNDNAQERLFLSRARDLYAKALGQTQGSFAQDTSDTAAPMGEGSTENAHTDAVAQDNGDADEGLDWENDPIGSLDAWYASGAIGDDEYNTMREAFEQHQQEQSSGAGKQYSIAETTDGRRAAIVDNDILKDIDTTVWDKNTKKAVKRATSEALRKFADGFVINGIEFIGNKRSRDEYIRTNYSEALARKNKAAYLDKMRAAAVLDDVIEVATDWKADGSLKHDRNDFVDFVRGNTLIVSGNRKYTAVVIAGITPDGKAVFYDVEDVDPVSFDIKKSEPSTAVQAMKSPDAILESSDERTVPQSEQKVKRQYSISEDTVSKKDVAGDLRAILKRGGSASELRQYVAQLERYSGKAEQKATSAEQTRGEAEQILKNARRQGIGVEEYLRQNWEQYDQDGQWNADAQKALELEKKAGRRYSISDQADQAYLDAVNQGDMEAAQKMVDQAAKAAGYDSPLLYHGTKSFGFTEFDLSKMDDKRSIFLTDNERIAATYSGVMGKRDASGHTLKNVESLSFQELVEELNSEQFGTVTEADDKFNYEYYSLSDINALISSVNTQIDSLKTEVPQMIREYADRMAADFSDKDHRTHEQLVKLDRLLQGYSYSDISTQLYMLLHHTDAFNATGEEASRIANLEKNIRLMNKLIVAGDPDGVIVESWLGGYTLNVLNKQQAMDRLGVKRKTGNYGLYAKLGNSLVIDAKGAVWNDIRHWSDAIWYNWNNTEVEKRGEMFALIDKKTGEEISEGSVAVNSYTEDMPARQLHALMLRKAQDSLSIITESMNTTREIAAFAQKRGYDSVVFQNLRDNGGNNAFIGAEEQASIYVLFDPSHAKSADPVAYDDKGNMIPLSQRFDVTKKDIRYSISEDGGAAQQAEAGQEEDIRGTMPRKAQDYLKRAERQLLWKIGDALSVPKLARREYLVPIIQELSNEYLRSGTITQEKLDLLFEKAYSEGVIVDAEFYDQYKHIKDYLRTMSVTISERDQADIADFKNFKRRAFGTLRIVNEGGLSVDSAYRELHEMAPELFPDSITHPADQLQRMFDAARSIQVTEKTVQDYYGKYEPEYRQGSKLDFEAAVGEVLGELRTVKRFADERRAKENQKAPATPQEAMAAYKELKTARRNYERVTAKNLLTAHDEMQVGRLLRHEIELEHLDPEKDNVKGITAVYEAKAEYDRLCKLIGEYKQHLRGQQRKKADKFLETANTWKDKKVGVLYSRETMRRNIQDIVPDPELARQINEEFFEPVHRSEAESNRFRTRYRDRVRGLLLSTKVEKGNLVSEAHAVQLLGEAEDNIRMLESMRGRIKTRDGKTLSEWQAVIEKLWLENPNLDEGKISNAVKTFRKIYDELFQQMNEVRVANGYEPVNYRNGYFPHFQPGDSDSILAQFGKMLGIDTQIDALPTTINGLTHTFKPGIQWFGNAQERLGFNTAYDAVEGFDKYIEGVASVIYHTENIQKLRALATQIRYRTSEKGIQEQVDAIYADPRYSEEEKQVMINEIYAHGKFALSNFVTELDEYTNLLANKKSKYDRTVEAMMGRRAYTFMKAWEAHVGANMIAGNLTSALTNFIPLTQAGAQMDRYSLLKGMWATLQAYRADDGIVGMSSFLTNRRGSDPLVQTWAQKASTVLGTPMELIDNFTADSIVRGAYYQNLKRGLTDVEAMNQADIFASNVMADRSKGAMPTLLQATNPLFKAFTQFQLEVNNQFSEVFKDLPRGFREKGLKALAWVLLKYFLGALLYNELYEKLIGRRPALDPIGILCDAVQDTVNLGIGEAGANLAVNLLEQLPFSSGLSLVGIEIDGGRIPASAAVPDLSAIWDAATTEGWSAEKRWKEVQDELNKLAYVVPPFGGNQASKLWKGVKAYIQGGSYTVDAAGNDILQYPVYKDSTEDAFWSLIRAALLGKSSLGTAQDWVDSGFDSLGAKQTAAYQDMLAAGVNDREAYALLQQIQNAKETASKKKDAVQREIIRDSKVSGEGKSIVYYGLMATEKEREIMDSLADLGADSGAVIDALMGMRDANALDGSAVMTAKYAAIKKAALTDEEKSVLVGSIMGTDLLTESGGLTQYAKFQYAIQNGMSVDQFIEYRSSGANFDDYLKLRDAGASIEDAMDGGIALQELKNSVEDPATVQKWRVVIDSTNDVQTQLITLSIVMSDSQYRKVQTAYNFGITPEVYVTVNESLPKYDVDGNGRYTQAEVTKAINAMRMKVSEKAALWQLVTGASSAKNNPYSAEIGQKVIDAIAAAKEKESESGPTFEEEIKRQLMGGK